MLKKLFTILAVSLVVVIFSTAFFYFSDIQNGVNFVTGLVFDKNIELKKADDSINVLLLGIGGGTHEGPELTDTIIFANIKPSKNEVNLVSFPRDLWIPELAYKINSVYAINEEKRQGIPESKKIIGKVLGQQIDYAVVVDFSGFVKLIDAIGGIEVNVQRSFADLQYPIAGAENDLCGANPDELPRLSTASAQFEAFPCRYKHIRFESGLQYMDGETALEFVRSRHATGSEGTDFARSQRQHLIISAVKDKVFSLGTILNPVKVFSIYNLVKDNVNTDIQTNEFDDFIKLAQKMKGSKTKNYILDTGDDKALRFGLLVNPKDFWDYKGQWVLIPRSGNGDFSEIQKYVNCITQGKICTVALDTIEIFDENTIISTPARDK